MQFNLISQWFREATAHHQAGNLQLAAELYNRILSANPKHADSSHLLGIIEAEFGNLEKALKLINEAIQQNSNFLPYYINRSLVYRRLGKLTEAIKDYNYILKKDPKAFDIYVNLGDALFELHQISSAIEAYQKAIELNNNCINAYNNLGNVYLAQENYEAALENYEKALVLDSDRVGVLSNAGAALLGLDKSEEAVNYCRKALELNPDYVQAYSNLGLVLAVLNKTEEAKKAYQQAISVDPNFADSYSHLGILYKDQNELESAIQYFKKALSLKPTHPEFQFNLGISQLLLGDFTEGLKNYESRFKLKERRHTEYNLSQPVWCGEDLTDKRLFVHVEQGLGDTIQHLRFLRLLNKYSNLEVFLETQPELHNLLQENILDLGRNIKLVPRRFPQFDFDYHIAIMSLARIFEITIDTIPDAAGYLKTSKNDYVLRNTFSKNSNFKIGLNWAGSELHKNDKNRSIDLKELQPLLDLQDEVPLFNFYSLQYGEAASEIKEFYTPLINLSPYINDLSDTASVINQLDLIITVDTAIAHLSGAMGKLTWVLLPFSPDFRWLLDRDDSPWYKSVRLFRQPNPKDWQSVITKICSVLLPRNVRK